MINAAATPWRRHGRRTEMWSSHARLMAMRSFSSALTQVITDPATSSPAQATFQVDVSSQGASNFARKSSSVRTAGSRWSRNASTSASQIAR